MKYVSEITKQVYNTEKECIEAEAQYKKKLEIAKAEEQKKCAERAKRAKEVEEAYKAAVGANKTYNEKLNQFIKDYGSFHMTYSDASDTVFDVFNSVFKIF